MQEHQGYNTFSSTASPNMRLQQKTASHVKVLGKGKVKGICYIHGILKEIIHILCSLIYTYIRHSFMGFSFL